jgi:cholesterol oxidase
MLSSNYVLTTADQLKLPLRRFSPSGRRPQRAVLMLHGASANSDTFLTPNGGLVAHLLEGGTEVWLLDWRGSSRVVRQYGPEHAPLFTFERVAEHDLGAALEQIRRVSPCRQVAVLGHCVGAACVAMALARGWLARFGVEQCVLSTIGLFFSAPVEGFLKAEDGILERVMAEDPTCTGIDPSQSRDWPEQLRLAYEAWPACLLPTGDAPGDEVYRRATFMFGAPYQRALVADDVHARGADLLGRIHLGLFLQAGQCLRRGFAASFDAPEVGPGAEAARRLYLDPTWFERTRVTLVTGKSNQLWHRESVDKMYEWLRNETRAEHRKHVLPHYGHQDLLWGRSATRDVYPLIVAGLAPQSAGVALALPTTAQASPARLAG